MPLDYIVEASTMQSMGIYTCLKVYFVTAITGPTLEDAPFGSEGERMGHLQSERERDFDNWFLLVSSPNPCRDTLACQDCLGFQVLMANE